MLTARGSKEHVIRTRSEAEAGSGKIEDLATLSTAAMWMAEAIDR